MNTASEHGHLEAAKYLYETCHSKIAKETIENDCWNTKSIFNVSFLQIKKYKK